MCFVAPPRPLDPWMGMTSPIDDLRQDETRSRGAADDGERIRTSARAAVLLLLSRQRRHDVVRRAARGRCAFRARPDQARLQLPHEHRVLGQRPGQLPSDAAATCGALRQAAEAVGGAIDERVASQNFLTGGSSPVATRQMPEAARRAAIVAAAPRPAYNPLHITLRSIRRSLLDCETPG